MKTILLFVLTAVTASAQNLSATLTEDIKMELSKGKGSILLKAGTAVEVVSKDGDSLTVVYHKIQGRVPLAKTDFKGEAPEGAPAAPAAPKETPKASPPAPTSPSAQTKPADPQPAAPSGGPDAPTTNYGKMVKKARDNEAKHKETLVDPTNEVSDSPKK